MPYNSSGVAFVPGTSSPLLLRCSGVRDVEKPSAPARSASSVSLLICAMSSAVATSLFAPRSPMTNARNAPCAICVPKSMTCGLRSSASRYSGNDSQSHVIPSTIAEPGISSTPSISSISHWWRSGTAGANPTPQLPMTAVVTPCQLLGVIHGSHVACAS